MQQFLAGRVAQVEIERDRLVLEIAQQAFEPVPDMGDYTDGDGNFKPLHELTPLQRRSIQGLDYVKRNLATRDKQRDDIVKLRLANIRAERMKAQELLARVMGWIRTEPPPPPLVPLFHIANLPPLTALPTVSRERRDVTCSRWSATGRMKSSVHRRTDEKGANSPTSGSWRS